MNRRPRNAAPLRVGLIGLGRIAWRLEKDRFRTKPCTHAGALRTLSNDFELVAACDTNAGRRNEFARWWRKPIAIQIANSELSKFADAVDLAIIAAPSEEHAELAERVIALGIPGIVLEKPITLDGAGARRLARRIERAGALCWINFERRYHNAYRAAADLLRSGALGDLRSIHGTMLTAASPPGATAGILVHDAVHWIDLLLWYAGPPQRVRARTIQSRDPVVRQDHMYCTFDYPAFRASLEAGGRRGYFEFEMRVDCSQGRIVLANGGQRFFRAGPSRRYQGFKELHEFRPVKKRNNPWLCFYSEIAADLRLALNSPSTANRADLYSRSRQRVDDAVRGLELIDQLQRNGERSLIHIAP